MWSAPEARLSQAASVALRIKSVELNRRWLWGLYQHLRLGCSRKELGGDATDYAGKGLSAAQPNGETSHYSFLHPLRAAPVMDSLPRRYRLKQ